MEAAGFCAGLGAPMAIATRDASWHPNEIYEMFADYAPGRAEISVFVPPEDMDAAQDILERHQPVAPPGTEIAARLHETDLALRRLLTRAGGEYSVELRIGPALFASGLYPRLEALQPGIAVPRQRTTAVGLNRREAMLAGDPDISFLLVRPA